MSYRVKSYETGETLAGQPSLVLVDRSAEAAPTGAVPARWDAERGAWVYVPPERRRLYRSGEVIAVWVEEV